MAEIRPFAGWRYDAGVAGDLTAVVAPPYDVIDDAHRDRLYDRSPHNVVRLILGREADRYGAAAACLRQWREQHVLVRDRQPALYLYSQEFPLEGEVRMRSGIIGAVRLEPFDRGVIRPHEKTLSGPKADRLKLMDATRTNLSPIFCLYAGASKTLDEARTTAAARPPLADLIDEFGVRHLLSAVSDPAVAAAIAAELAPRTIYIADGHHRYETALAYRDNLAAGGALPPDHPANFVMMYLCSTADPGLVILPTHRLVGGLAGFDAKAFLGVLGSAFHLRQFPHTDAGASELQTALRAAAAGSFGFAVRGAGALHLATLADSGLMAREAPGVAPEVRALDVLLLDVVVLRKLLGVDAHEAAQDGRLRYVKEAAEALASVRRGQADVACLLNATRMDEVARVCDAGETMPEKSTYFHPKLGSGFVFHSLESEEAGS